MTLSEKYDRMITGLISGLIFPFIIGIIIFLFSSGDMSLGSYLYQVERIRYYNTLNHPVCISEYIYFSVI